MDISIKLIGVIDRRGKIYYPLIETKKYIKLFYLEEKNNFSQEIDKIVVNSTSFPNQVFIFSVLEPILKYYSTEGYITTIKNSKRDEISLEELVEQYFGNPEDYFESKKIIEAEPELGEEKETEFQKEEPLTQQERDEKYRKEQEEIKKWG